jgi:hypothetical protein
MFLKRNSEINLDVYKNVFRKSISEVILHPTLSFPLTPFPMNCHVNHPKQPSSREDKNHSDEYIHSPFYGLLEPEEDDTSDVQSFNEDDMYGSDIGNDIVITVPESKVAIQSFDEDDMYSSDIGNDNAIRLPESKDNLQTSSDDVLLTLPASVDDVWTSLVGMVSHLSFLSKVLPVTKSLSSLMISFKR